MELAHAGDSNQALVGASSIDDAPELRVTGSAANSEEKHASENTTCDSPAGDCRQLHPRLPTIYNRARKALRHADEQDGGC